jgi:hypothetical protein
MSRLARVAATVVVALAACALAPPALAPRARASSTQVSILMDDDQLVYASQRHMLQTLRTLHALGVNVVKVSLVWQLVAPKPNASTKPRFDDTDPAAYPAGAWSRYDALVEAAERLGMKVYFLLIGPAPRWAVPKGQPHSQGPSLGYAPILRDFRDFVLAVGRRYSGAYVPPAPPHAPTSTSVAGVTIPTITATQPQAPPPEPLPRVDYWGIWNEPNERSWLNPWYRTLSGHRRALIQPELYRGIVDAAWAGLSASDHSSDTVLIGETANRGVLTPAQFVRGLYCVGSNLKPLRGAAAQAIGCPTSGSAQDFVAVHPGLFESAGFAHHPYGFDVAPNRRYPDGSFITLYNLPSLERLLNGIFVTYGLHPAGGVPLYLTEWGYKTDPPNPYAHVSPAEQAAWLDEGDYMTWREPFVRSLAQFLLIDSPPKPHTPKGSPLYWSTFQTGLENTNGRPKPAFYSYRLPIWLPSARHGAHVYVWGQLRLADPGSTEVVAVEFKGLGSSQWQAVAYLQTDSPEGFLSGEVALPAAGSVRLAWQEPGGAMIHSRTVAVS